MYEGGTEVDYVQKWEQVRVRQNQLKCEEVENEALERLHHSEFNIQKEILVHGCIIDFIERDLVVRIPFIISNFDEFLI